MLIYHSRNDPLCVSIDSWPLRWFCYSCALTLHLFFTLSYLNRRRWTSAIRWIEFKIHTANAELISLWFISYEKVNKHTLCKHIHAHCIKYTYIDFRTKFKFRSADNSLINSDEKHFVQKMKLRNFLGQSLNFGMLYHGTILPCHR